MSVHDVGIAAVQVKVYEEFWVAEASYGLYIP